MAISRVNYGSVATGTTSLSIANPSSIQADDVLVCFVVDRATSGTTNGPTGWTRGAAGAGTGGRIQYFWAVQGRNSLGAGPHTFSGLTTACMGQIVAYRGCDPLTPNDATATARRNAASASGTTAVTTVNVNTMVVAAFASFANGCTWSAEAVATSPTITEFQDNANGTSLSLAVCDGEKSATGSTGASSGTMSTTANNGGALLALRPILVPKFSYHYRVRGCA